MDEEFENKALEIISWRIGKRQRFYKHDILLENPVVKVVGGSFKRKWGKYYLNKTCSALRWIMQFLSGDGKWWLRSVYHWTLCVLALFNYRDCGKPNEIFGSLRMFN